MKQFSIYLHMPVTYIHTPEIDIYTQTLVTDAFQNCSTIHWYNLDLTKDNYCAV